MSESDGEHAARSVALEQAYVHEVYEQCAEKTTQSKHWPRVYQFLQELEPGALVCDIGQSKVYFTRDVSLFLLTNSFHCVANVCQYAILTKYSSHSGLHS